MKILVVSDSHSALSFMRRCAEMLKPDALIHLGDYWDDGQAISELFPEIPMVQVPGNCDRYRCEPEEPEIKLERMFGADLYLTHGHRHNVKRHLTELLRDARKCRAAAALYGHTHTADCHRERDGLWVLNPGSCGYFGGSVGLMEVENGKITDCRILREEDLQAL